MRSSFNRVWHGWHDKVWSRLQPRATAFAAFLVPRVRHHPYRYMAGIVSLTAALSVAVATSTETKILPVGSEVTKAYDLLLRCPTGRDLSRRVRRVIPGGLVFLALGDRERDELYDRNGRPVRGVTRVVYCTSGRLVLPKSLTVITNRDVTDSDPREIVKSLAFELENILYSFANPYADSYGADSPEALLTQQRVMEELRL